MSKNINIEVTEIVNNGSRAFRVTFPNGVKQTLWSPRNSDNENHELEIRKLAEKIWGEHFKANGFQSRNADG
jgi:hypothetical protein